MVRNDILKGTTFIAVSISINTIFIHGDSFQFLPPYQLKAATTGDNKYQGRMTLFFSYVLSSGFCHQQEFRLFSSYCWILSATTFRYVLHLSMFFWYVFNATGALLNIFLYLCSCRQIIWTRWTLQLEARRSSRDCGSIATNVVLGTLSVQSKQMCTLRTLSDELKVGQAHTSQDFAKYWMPSVLDKGCTAQEFENAWVAFVDHYGLQDENEYLQNAQKIIDDESDQNDSWVFFSNFIHASWSVPLFFPTSNIIISLVCWSQETDADKLTDVKIRVDPPKLLVQAHGDQSEDQVNLAPLKACKDCKPSVN